MIVAVFEPEISEPAALFFSVPVQQQWTHGQEDSQRTPLCLSPHLHLHSDSLQLAQLLYYRCPPGVSDNIGRPTLSLSQTPLQGLLQGQTHGLRLFDHSLLHRRPRVASAQMFDHLELLPGSVGAVAAAERLLVRVRQEVVPEARGPSEGLGTQAAGVEASVAVLPLVCVQYKSGFEGFAAFLAHVGSKVTVLGVSVGAEGVSSVGAVVALTTGVGFLSCTTQKHTVTYTPIRIRVRVINKYYKLF